MTKLKAESELQQNRLLEYELVNEQHVQQKTRLEEEVRELMKKVQERENVRQRPDLDASSKLSGMGAWEMGIGAPLMVASSGFDAARSFW